MQVSIPVSHTFKPTVTHSFLSTLWRRITDGLGEVIPNLENLVLTNNHLQELGDLDPLAECKKLIYLSLLSNPVANKQHYRSYVIHKIPSLRVLDFNKVKESEREAAKLMFKSKKGKELAKQLGQKTKNFAAEGAAKEKIGKIILYLIVLQHYNMIFPLGGPSAEEARAIREAIANASTLEEVERLNQMLRAGVVPGKATQAKNGSNGNYLVSRFNYKIVCFVLICVFLF